MKNIKWIIAIDRIRGGLCPICGQSNVDYCETQMGSPAHQEASCGDCYATWREYYVLNDVEIDELGTVKDESGTSHVLDIEDDGLGSIEKIPEILDALLSQKKVLPAFIGIDNMLDKLIEKKLGGQG